MKKEESAEKKVKDADLKKMISDGTIEGQTVGWIKDVLLERGIETKARIKAKLIEELKEWAHWN